MKKFTLISLPLYAVVLAAMLVALTPGPAQAGGPPPCVAPFSDCVFANSPADPIFFPFEEPEGAVLIPLIGVSFLVGGGPVLLEIFEPAAEGGGISDLLLFTNNVPSTS